MKCDKGNLREVDVLEVGFGVEDENVFAPEGVGVEQEGL